MRDLTTTNLDYLTARLHGRRSRMAEAGRLDLLCRLRVMPDLVRQIWPDSKAQAVADFQRRLVADLVREVAEFLPFLDTPGARLVEWMLVRLQAPAPTPPVSWAAFAASLPVGPLRKSVQAASGNLARPFFMEAALDRGYYRELLVRAEKLPEPDKVLLEPLVRHEAETFQRNFFARGRINYSLAPEVLAQFAVISSIQPDELPAEAAAWNRLYRLANRAMRGSPTGLGTVVGYVALRRVEIANLTALSEGLRLGLSDESIRARMIPRSATHV
jgi:hypothetical protein